jgi:hypothetical protein
MAAITTKTARTTTAKAMATARTRVVTVVKATKVETGARVAKAEKAVRENVTSISC